MNEEKLQLKLEKARFHIFSREPFLGYILQQYPIFFSDLMNTAATNGKHILFNRKFLDSLSMDETIFVLCHEVLHIILDHLNRKKDRDHFLFNVSCDIVVNSILIDMDFNKGNLSIIDGYKLHKIIGRSYSAEYIYDKLPKNIEYNPFDNHDLWESNRYTNEQIKKIISDAIHLGYKCSNKIISREIELLERKFNLIKWRKILEPLLRLYEKDYTFEKIDNRYHHVLLPDYLHQKESLQNIWFCVDVSGSMSKKDIEQQYQIMHSIIQMYPSIACEVSFFSTVITSPKIIKNHRDLQVNFMDIKSTGGTSFQCIIDGYHNFYKYKKPIALIIMTDGQSDYPEKENAFQVPLIWVINNQDHIPPYGKVITI